MCQMAGDYEFPGGLSCEEYMGQWTGFSDTITMDAWWMMAINSHYGNMTRGRWPNFDASGADLSTHPAIADFVDFTKVGGVDVYHFVSSNDEDCTPAQAEVLATDIPTFAGTTTYGCYSHHEWFNLRGLGQAKWMEDMAATLAKPVVAADVEFEDTEAGATTLAVSALAAIATLSLVM